MEKRSEDNAESKELPSTSSSPTEIWEQRLVNSAEFVPQHVQEERNAPEASSSDTSVPDTSTADTSAPPHINWQPEIIGFDRITMVVPLVRLRNTGTALNTSNASQEHTSGATSGAQNETIASVPTESYMYGHPMAIEYQPSDQRPEVPNYNLQGQHVQNQQAPVATLPRQYEPSPVQPSVGHCPPFQQMPDHYQQAQYYQGQQIPNYYPQEAYVQNQQVPLQMLPGQYGAPQAQPLAVQYPPFQQMPPQYQPVQQPQAAYVPTQQPQVYQGQVQQTSGYYMPSPPTPYPQHGQYHPDLPQTAHFVPEQPHQAQLVPVHNPGTYSPQVHIGDHRGQSIPTQMNDRGMQFRERLPKPRQRKEFPKATYLALKESVTKEHRGSGSPAETTPAETTPAETTPAETTPAETTPAETTPAETTPAETTPAETTPAERDMINVNSADLTPASTTLANDIPAKSSLPKEAPAAVTLANVAPTDLAPVRTAAAKDSPAENSPAENSPAKTFAVVVTTKTTTPTSTNPVKDTPVKEASAKAIQVKASAPKTIPVRTTPAIPSSTTLTDVNAAKSTSNISRVIRVGQTAQSTSVPGRAKEKCIHPKPPAVENLNLELLFIGDEPVDLPEFGMVSRSDYEKNKLKYHRTLLQHQQVLLDSIKTKGEPTKPAEEEFQLVSKHKSFDKAKLTDKQREAVRSAIKDNRQAKSLAGNEKKTLAALKQTDTNKDRTSEEPCSSSSLQQTSSRAGADKAKQGEKPKAEKNKNKGKKKESVESNKIFFDVDNSNAIMLDAYYKLRREYLNIKCAEVDEPGNPAYFSFENVLINNATNHFRNLTPLDMEVKNDFCSKVLAELPTMELSGDVKEEHREMLIRFVQLLSSRDDDILLMDIAIMVSTLMSSEHNAAHFLWLYHTLCSQQETTADTTDSNGTPTQETSGSSKSKAKKTQKEEDEDEKAFREAAELNMSLKVDTYYKKRREFRDSKYCPPDIPNLTESFLFEKMLITNILIHPEITDINVKFKTVVCQTIIGKLSSWGFSAEQQKTLTDFYTHLAGRNDDILIMDAFSLNEVIRGKYKNCASTIYTYYLLCTSDRFTKSPKK